MGNQPSKASSSPSTAANDPNVPPRRSAKRRESPHSSPLSARSTTSTATAALENVAAKASHRESRATSSQSRGRAETIEGKGKEKSSHTPVEPAPVPITRAATTPYRSLSPRRAAVKAPPPIATNFATESAPRDAASPSPGVGPAPYYPSADYIRPPRLPLPLEDDLLSPGSPIISPADIGAALQHNDAGNAMPRRASVLSSTTLDEDDVGDEIYRPLDQGSGIPGVDTLIEWKQGGKKVYVTGTFANYWNKKYKLHENGPSKDPKAFSAVIPLPPGTHHVTFLVDGQMRTASHMPTAVDWTNALVNYIEVGPSDPTRASAAAQPQPAQPQPIQPRSAAENRRSTMSAQCQPMPPTPELRPTAVTPTPQLIPAPSTSTIPTRIPSRRAQTSHSHSPATVPGTNTNTSTSTVLGTSHTPRKVHHNTPYHTEIPRFLIELDSPEDSSRYLRANAATSTLPAPPSLPMFLSKSILNGTTPMKDDSSVLNMPNHTVLNHLATSSIKSGVLATSATTRYKKKYVTTILYKPTSEADDE